MTQRTSQTLLPRTLLLTLALSGTACIPIGDPEGPGAEGSAAIPKGVDMAPYQTLVVRMVPRDGEFDPEAPDFRTSDDDAILDGSDLDGDREVDFSVGDPVGTTPHKRWRLFAWLSADDDWWEAGQAGRPPKGAPYGVVDFSIDDCDRAYDDYCGVTHEVEVTLSEVAP